MSDRGWESTVKDKAAARQRRKAEAERSEGGRGRDNEREGLRQTMRTEGESLSKETGWQIAPATAAAAENGGRALALRRQGRETKERRAAVMSPSSQVLKPESCRFSSRSMNF